MSFAAPSQQAATRRLPGAGEAMLGAMETMTIITMTIPPGGASG